MYKKLSITTFIFLLLTITISFAWMIELEGPKGDTIIYQFDDSIHVSPNNLKIDVQFEEDGVYKPLYSTDNQTNSLASFRNSAPGDVIKFSVKINNLTEDTIETSIVFSEISSSIEDFYNYISIGIFSVSGFDRKHPAPSYEEFLITDRMDKDSSGNLIIEDQNSVLFLENLKIPPKGQEVEIKFYVRFNSIRESQNHLQNQWFTIGKMNFMFV